MKYAARFVVLLTLVSAAPLRAEPVANPGQPTVASRDPNERICENIITTGSRLATKRFCGTRAEWEARQKQDRDVVEDAQRHATDPCHSVQTHTGAPTC
jgi:hypothetical protein